jgi:hypothetical protein
MDYMLEEPEDRPRRPDDDLEPDEWPDEDRMIEGRARAAIARAED